MPAGVQEEETCWGEGRGRGRGGPNPTPSRFGRARPHPTLDLSMTPALAILDALVSSHRSQFSFNAPSASALLGTGSKSPRTVRRHSGGGGRLLPTPTHYKPGGRRGSFQGICDSAVSGWGRRGEGWGGSAGQGRGV